LPEAEAKAELHLFVGGCVDRLFFAFAVAHVFFYSASWGGAALG
jgi:hypothetical protein